MRFRYTLLALSVGLALGALTSRAIAHGFITDQECIEDYGLGSSIRFEEPFGQEFIPQMSSLDVVELVLGNQGGAAATVAVRIRLHTIDGSVVAVSNPLVLPHPTERGWQHLDFASSVPLIPGELYVMEFLDLAGTGNPSAWGSNNNLYAPGHAIFDGIPDEWADFSFREGPVSPVPVEATTWGRVKALYH